MNGHYIYAWDARRHGLPKNYDVAVAMAQELYQKQDGEPCEGLPLFADAVDAYLREYGDEDSLEQFLWDLPKRARGKGRTAMRMEMPYEDWEHILVKMVEEAARHQVVLVDEEMVMVFLPDGKIFPPAGKKVWQGLPHAWGPDAEFPTSKGQFKKWFEPQLMRILAKYGDFKKGRLEGEEQDSFAIRTGGQFIQSIDYDLSGSGGEFGIRIMITLSHKFVSDIARNFKFILPQDVVSGEVHYNLLRPNSSTKAFMVKNWNDAQQLLNDADDIFHSAFPLSETVQDLDSLLNGEADIRFRDHFQNYVFMPQCLIVARLAGNPHFEELVLKLGSTNGWYANGEVMETEWPRLVEYLRNEVKPIV